MTEYTPPRKQNKYVDFKTNGRLFPSWVMANFKKYKLPEIFIKEGEDPCNRKTKQELRIYQQFLAEFLDYKSPYQDILIYHQLGSGKTVSAINIYNMLYNYTPGWNVFVLIKASLKDDPWLKDLSRWLQAEEKEFRMKNITFLSYDSPIADKQFIEAIRNADTTKKNLYIVDEAHNFIRNVYSNVTTQQGRRAQSIYDYIIQDKKENEGVRVVLLSGTPTINNPYELGLLFNLLRPGSFPKSESEFNQLYVTQGTVPSLNSAYKNMFQRRIMGLVSYYIGATPDLYASKKMQYVDVEMSDYQEDIYNYFEEKEELMARKKKAKQSGSETYKSYTRQSSNFVFPAINQWVTGELRPRPSAFKISEREAEAIEEARGKLKVDKGSDKYMNVQKYKKTTEQFTDTFDEYLREAYDNDKKNNKSIADDFKTFVEKYDSDYNKFVREEKKKSELFEALHKSSAKMVNIIFNIMKSKGPVLVYSNYVYMEGIEIFKIFLKYFGFTGYEGKDKGKNHYRYIEYHGDIEISQRKENLLTFNSDDNIVGELVKIIMISPAGAEGINLENVRQVHIMEPYWNEIRITQMIGRAVRQCSHRRLPMKDRVVDVFRYKSIRKKSDKQTTDQYIEELARKKDGLIQSFWQALKEVAVDCALYKNHNMMNEEYKCFQFDEVSLFDTQIGPAYKEDVKDDKRIDNGLNSTTSIVKRIKVRKIKAVIQLTDDENPKYSEPDFYWYYPESGVVYEYEFHYAIGRVAFEEINETSSIPKKLDKDTYIIDKVIPIPQIK